MNPDTWLTLYKVIGFIGALVVVGSSIGVWRYENVVNRVKDKKIDELVIGKNELLKQNSILEEKIDKILKALLDEQDKYLKQQYELQEVSGRLIPPVPATKEEPCSLLFGGNTFIGTPKVLVVGGVPLITMKVVNDTLYISTTIYDEKGQVLALIRNNEWIYERSAQLRKEDGINYIKIWDKDNKLILDCELLSDKRIRLNGIFRRNGAEIIATNNGLSVKSSGREAVGLGGN